MILNYCDKAVLTYAVRHGAVGLSAVRGCCRCGDERARFILRRLSVQGFLVPAMSGGFLPTERARTEVLSA